MKKKKLKVVFTQKKSGLFEKNKLVFLHKKNDKNENVSEMQYLCNFLKSQKEN